MPQVTFLTPADLRDTVRAMAVISLLHDKNRDVRFWHDPSIPADVSTWKDVLGNECRFVFHKAGAVIVGFDPKSALNPFTRAETPDQIAAYPGVYDALPAALGTVLQAQPFDDESEYHTATFCIWNTGKTKTWTKGSVSAPAGSGKDADGQEHLLGRIRGYYADFATECLNMDKVELDEDAVTELLSGDEISAECLKKLKPKLDVDDVREDLVMMGFVIGD